MKTGYFTSDVEKALIEFTDSKSPRLEPKVWFVFRVRFGEETGVYQKFFRYLLRAVLEIGNFVKVGRIRAVAVGFLAEGEQLLWWVWKRAEEEVSEESGAYITSYYYYV